MNLVDFIGYQKLVIIYISVIAQIKNKKKEEILFHGYWEPVNLSDIGQITV